MKTNRQILTRNYGVTETLNRVNEIKSQTV